MVETKVATLGAISPFFIVRDLQETVSFYTNQLGFEVKYMGPDPDPFWALLGRDNVSIFMKHISDEVQPMPNPQRHTWAAWDAYVYVPEPQALAAEFESRGCQFSKPLQVNTDNLIGFEVSDPNGYVLYFGKPNN